MQIQSIQNYGLVSNKKLNETTQTEKSTPANAQVAFGAGDEIHGNKGSNAYKNLIYGLMMLGSVAAGSTALQSCDRDAYAYAYAEPDADVKISIIDSLACHCHCSPDTVRMWYYGFNRPQPLDSLYNNFKNWDIDGTDGDRDNPKANRNVTHYEGTREWEYNSRETGDIRLTESSRNVLVYDTEVKDYKGNHESYGKRVFRLPTASFKVITKDGDTLTSPKGLFVEEYENPTDNPKASILDCNLKTRAFVTTNGDTLNVAKLKGTNEYVETGKVAKGYLGANTVLLKSLIGMYPTDDHYTDFKVTTVDDETLRQKYVLDMDFEKTENELNGNN